MAKKTASKVASKDGVNKSEEIRRLAKDLQGKGERVRPVTIVNSLKAKGIIVAPPQVSMVLKKMGFKPRKRVAAPAVKKSKSQEISFADLQRAKKMAEDFGGAEKLVNALSCLVELQ